MEMPPLIAFLMDPNGYASNCKKTPPVSDLIGSDECLYIPDEKTPQAGIIRCILPIVPTAQQRPRFTRLGSKYKSKEQEANERTLESLLVPYMPKTPFVGPVQVFMTAYLPIAKGVSKKRKAILEQEKTPCTKKPDCDNLAKQILDAMTRLRFWEDDKQVWTLLSRKVYSPRPRWDIVVLGEMV